jgi:hypothetical protein
MEKVQENKAKYNFCEYTARGHNLRLFGAVIFGAAWSLTRAFSKIRSGQDDGKALS